MKCIEARRMVTPFVKKELSGKDMEAFLDHIEHCSDCMDELDIYYMVHNALNLMDSGTRHEYDFKKMLAEEVRSAKRSIARRKVMFVTRTLLILLAEALLLVNISIGIRMKIGLEGESIFQRMIMFLYEEESETEWETAPETEQEYRVTETVPETEQEYRMTETPEPETEATATGSAKSNRRESAYVG